MKPKLLMMRVRQNDASKRCCPRGSVLGLLMLWAGTLVQAADVELVGDVERQPLAANIDRVIATFDMLGHPLPEEVIGRVRAAATETSALPLQQAVDRMALAVVQINPEYRVKVSRGPAAAELLQHGYVPFLIKVINEAAFTERLRIDSPQAGAVYAGTSANSLERQQQIPLGEKQNVQGERGRIFDLSLHRDPPLTPHLSGLKVEYVVALISCSESGRREATLAFDVGQGTQDLGFRGEVPILFDVQPAIPVTLSIRDSDGRPTVARLEIRDQQGRVYPPQSKRLAPDFFFQPHIYRADGANVWLPPGQFQIAYSRGPEYLVETRDFTVSPTSTKALSVQLTRWVDPLQRGFVSGDHHIHAAGCAHYTSPTEGVSPQDMFLQVKGEGLNVGCVLTWGPCFDFQRRYFSSAADLVSEPLTVLKYDLEISGFGSAALGHVCLLNLQDQTYPGSEGTMLRGWPTWTAPVLRWAKDQGGVTGYPHADMLVDPPGYARRVLHLWDRNGDGLLDRAEAAAALLPERFEVIDSEFNGSLSLDELTASGDRASQKLPHLVLPSMRGAGAMELFVTTAEGVCDFTSSMNTGRIGEWNTWYHILNCGFPLKLSGETDFPCMSSRNVGQGRTYVKMSEGSLEQIDFAEWCAGLGAGRSYVSDGYAHALEFMVNGQRPGTEDLMLDQPATVLVETEVTFAPQTPEAVAHGTALPPTGHRDLGDTRILHLPRSERYVSGGSRLVEIVRNGEVVASQRVPADGQLHRLEFRVPIDRSSWLALRQFPQLHTNPLNVLVGGRPIRASAASAEWCALSVELCWDNRSRLIAEAERPAALAAYRRAAAEYRRRGAEASAID